MDKTTTGHDNLYYELEPPKKESDVPIYDDVAADIDDTTTPATTRTSYEDSMKFQGAKAKKNRSTENASQSDTVLIRRLVFISTAVVAVAFLTAVATLILALSIMMSRNLDNINSRADLKDSGPIYELLTNLAAEVKQMKDKLSHVQSLTSSKMDQNKTLLWFAIQKEVNTSLTEKLIDVQQQIIKLDQKVTNSSRAPLPRGPPGYNGTQGLPGPPGPSGSGNLTLCSYVRASSAGETPDVYARQSVERTESNGKTFLGVYCDSNDAKFVALSASNPGGKRKYTCSCANTLTSGDSNMYCYIHYWECPT